MRGRRINFNTFAKQILERKKLKAYKTFLGARVHITRLMDFFAGYELSEITDQAWSDYCNWRREQRPGCVLFDDRKWLMCILLAAYYEGLVPRKPKLTVYHEPSDRGRELSRDEIRRLYAHAIPALRFQIDIALYMGLRKQEMLTLDWSQFDWDSRNVEIGRIVKTKTKKKRNVPISPVVLERFRSRHRVSRSPKVFPHAHDVRRSQTENKRTWYTCQRNAGVDCCWHDLRHTCATWLVRANVPLPVIKRMLGMSIKILLEIYAHVSGDDLHSASKKISENVVSKKSRKVRRKLRAA